MSEISKRCDVCGAPLEWAPMWGTRVCRACVDREWGESLTAGKPTVRVYERVCHGCGRVHADRDTTPAGQAPNFTYYCPTCAIGPYS